MIELLMAAQNKLEQMAWYAWLKKIAITIMIVVGGYVAYLEYMDATHPQSYSSTASQDDTLY